MEQPITQTFAGCKASLPSTSGEQSPISMVEIDI
jgi:hypothetical protein